MSKPKNLESIRGNNKSPAKKVSVFADLDKVLAEPVHRSSRSTALPQTDRKNSKQLKVEQKSSIKNETKPNEIPKPIENFLKLEENPEKSIIIDEIVVEDKPITEKNEEKIIKKIESQPVLIASKKTNESIIKATKISNKSPLKPSQNERIFNKSPEKKNPYSQSPEKKIIENIKIPEKFIDKSLNSEETKKESLSKIDETVSSIDFYSENTNKNDLTLSNIEIIPENLNNNDSLSKIQTNPIKKSSSPLKPKPNIVESFKKVSKIQKTEDLLSSIDNILSKNSFNHLKNEESRSPEKHSKNPKVSISPSPLKRNSSIEEISNSDRKSKNKEILYKKTSKNEPIYTQFKKIANKPRPDISPPKNMKKRSPSRKTEEIDSFLYEDAIRRQSIHYEKPEFYEFSTSLNSQQFVAKKFIKEYFSALENIEIVENKVDLASFVKILCFLNFIKNDPDNSKFEEENSQVLKF